MTTFAAFARTGPTIRPLALILLTIEAQLLDALTWVMAVRRVGIRGEANPLVVAAYHTAGIDGVLAIKLLAAAALCAIAVRLPGRWWALLPAIVGLFGALTNLAPLI
jgi:hypothetical protein